MNYQETFRALAAVVAQREAETLHGKMKKVLKSFRKK